MQTFSSRLAVVLALVAVAGLLLSPAVAQKPAPKKEEPKKSALTVELYKDNGGKFRFRIKGADGANLGGATKGYETRADCQKVIDLLKTGLATANVMDVTAAKETPKKDK